MVTGQASPVRTVLTRAGKTIRPTASSPPIRQVLADRRELMSLGRTRTRSPLATVHHYAGTTPGKLVMIGVVLVLAILSVGWYGSTVLQDRTNALKSTIDQGEPLAEASQVLYSSLSIADASANSAFISGGLESPDLRSRYSNALATASASLMKAAGTSGAPGENTDDDDRAVNADLQTLATTIPVYSGLIETARTNNRLGNSVGSAYLGQASALMHDQILPAAQRLYDRRFDAIADPQRTLTIPPYGVYFGLLVLALSLIGTSRFLTTRTRRRFNIGVVAALIAILGGLVWLLVSGLASVAATNSAKTDGAALLRQLTEARILTQQARSAETLSLVQRTDQSDLDQSFSGATGGISTILADLGGQTSSDDGALTTTQVRSITTALDQWRESDRQTRAAIERGDFTQARTLTVGADPQSTASSYAAVDSSLTDAITTTRTSFRDDINTAQRVIGYTGSGILVLTIFAAVALALGLVPRVREYR
ncbi:hypothetical protein EF294_13885 [Gordonia oryzae]|uniref:Uncharacterized protein n=1 Tax=Gordonia oryzae TaxID=2487349 RepID=A0A3N4G893_9ACTN|nr:hypothetical protein EF294_13885 [Gordonia oryzae]